MFEDHPQEVPVPEDLQRPRVAFTPSPWPMVVGFLGALSLGAVVFLQLYSKQKSLALQSSVEGVSVPLPASSQPALPQLQLPAYEPPEAALAPSEPVLEAKEPVIADAPFSVVDHDTSARLRAPALIVDLSQYDVASPASGTERSGLDPRALASASVRGTVATVDQAFTEPAPALGSGDSGTRYAGPPVGPSKPSVATRRIDLAYTIVEGSVVPAVLETPINSELPGYVRAVVSRDVRGFDGSKVLAPRGSRLIGQYRSGTALGQSRTFVIWTRLIRPDGAAIDLASPSTDALGRGGLDGEVDRHFLQRFGGAMLLSLISLGAAAADSTDTSIVIASTRAGAADTAGIALSNTAQISPTITVPQGAPVRVFVTQDLEFSGVGAESETSKNAIGK